MARLASIARRHRWGQAILFAVTVGLLVGTAAVDPLLTRSFSDSLVRFHAEQQGVAGRQVALTSGGQSLKSFERLENAVDPRARAVTADPTESTYVDASSAALGVKVRIQSTHDQCSHVRVVRGRCPEARNEVMVSRTAIAQDRGTHLKVGADLTVVGSYTGVSADLNPRKTMHVVGVFTVSASDDFWLGADVGAYVPPPAPPGVPGPAEYWLTDDATFTGSTPTKPLASGTDAPASIGWSGVYRSVAYPVVTARLNPSSLSAATAGLLTTQEHAGDDVNILEALSSVQDTTHQDVDQVGQILPFLLVQLGVVLLILLVQVTSFFATVRRGEAAVLKMRGNGSSGVVRLGAAEFLPAAVAGIVGGLVLAYVVDGLVRHLWLPGSVAAQWNWTTLFVALAMCVLVAIVWFLCWWTMARESISSLLRSRPRRRGARLSMPAAVFGALCLVGVILTATKSLTGAPVQVTPVLLAGFVAIVVGVLLAPVAGRLVRRVLGSGRAATALAVAQLGRRAGVVTAVTTLIITSALLTQSVSVFARGADNRSARAAADVGAAAIVHTDAGAATLSGQDLIKAVDSIDPQHRRFTPTVEINASTPTSYATLGVVPADMERIGARTGVRHPVPWSSLETGTSAGKPAALLATWTMNGAVGSTVTAPTMADVDGDFQVVGAAPYIPGAGERTIVVDLRTMLAAGDRQVNVSFQVLSTTQDQRQLAHLDEALRKVGFASTDVETMHEVRATYDATATAWAMNLSIVVSVLSLLAALTSVVLVAVASRSERQRDLRALRTGGVSRAVLRRATVGEFVLLALLGSVIGALTAPLAAWLTGRTMLWWSTPPEQPVTRTGFQWSAGSLAAAGLIVLLALVGAAFGIRLARSAAADNTGRSAG